MKATQQLIDEHGGILLMLSILENICGRLERGEKVSVDDLLSIVDFLQTFADKCHHGKEEALLFPLLEQKGMPKENGPIGVMLEEHTQGRNFISGLRVGIEEYKQSGQYEKINENGRGYIELLRAHINKENNVLFPMSDKALTPKEDEELIREFEKVEVEKIGIGKHEEFHILLEKLSKKYLENTNE